MKKLITASTIMTICFLVVVILYGKLKNVILGENMQLDIGYTTGQMVFGVLGESIRSVLTSWLYIHHDKNKSIINAISFGLICSLMIGAIWLLIGMEFLGPQNKLSFLIDDGIILFSQGIMSGIILWLVYKDNESVQTS